MEYNELIEINEIEIRKIANIKELFGDPKALVSKETTGSVSVDIVNLLIDKSIRRGDGVLFTDVEERFKDKITSFVVLNMPIEIVFQGFPFKCQNPFETLRKTPDLGEVAFLRRLGDINETVKQVYLPGIKFTVIGEGKLYKDLFGASEAEAETFERRVKQFIGLVGLNDVVKLVDFVDLLDSKKDFFLQSKKEEQDVSINTDGFEQLTHVMMRSLPIAKEVPHEDLFKAFSAGSDLGTYSDAQLNLLADLTKKGGKLAIKYLAVQEVKKKMDIIKSRFPNQLYISTTAKRNRYSFHPIHRRTRLYPHHGVPIFDKDKVDIMFLGEIISNPENFVAVYCGDDVENAPFCFLKGRQHRRK